MNSLLIITLLALMSCAHTDEMSPLIEFGKHDLINVGEFHGTKETPEYFFSLVSKYAQINSNEQIALGLEIPNSEERHVRDFIRTGDQNYLKKSYFFTQKYQDGRASIDMVRGLKLISNLKNITVFCFDQNKPLDNKRDKVMAQNIISVSKTKSFNKIFTYSGNLHATKEIGTPWEPKRKPMGFF